MAWITRNHYYDGQGSTRTMTDGNGSVTDRFTYDAWGQEVTRTGTSHTPFTWKGMLGYFRDSSGGFQVRRRGYEPRKARFTAHDPMGVAEGPNRYLYAGNNPTTNSDPSGELIVRPGHVCWGRPVFDDAFIQNRGSFRGVTVLRGRFPDEVGSQMFADFPTGNLFTNKPYVYDPYRNIFRKVAPPGCCACDIIQFEQIVKRRIYTSNWIVNIAQSHDWIVDANITRRPGKPCRLGGSDTGSMDDAPGASNMVREPFLSTPIMPQPFHTIYEAAWDFETCAYCLVGCEGVSLRHRSWYGCFKWGFAGTVKPKYAKWRPFNASPRPFFEEHYDYTRYIGPYQLTGEYDLIVDSPSNRLPASVPSVTFMRVMSEYAGPPITRWPVLP